MRNVFNIRGLDPVNIDKLICLKGIIIRVSTVMPDMQSAHYQCCKCKETLNCPVMMGKISEPDYCENCKSKGTFEIIHNKCEFWDK